MRKSLTAVWLTLVLMLMALAAMAEENTQVTHYLLLGQDGYAEEVTDDARTDTILLVSLDEKYNRVVMTSILRDCMIDTPRGNPTKINLLYRNYGFDGLIECVERELDVEIEGGVLVNFEHVKPVIDKLGGVDIEITNPEYLAIRNILLGKDPNMPDGPGMTHMTGRIALAYMRARATGEGGDFARTERQRKVLSQLVHKCRDLSLMELVGIYNDVSQGMEMNLGPLDILSAFKTGYGLVSNGAQFVQSSIPHAGQFYYDKLNSSSVLNVRWDSCREELHELLDNPTEP